MTDPATTYIQQSSVNRMLAEKDAEIASLHAARDTLPWHQAELKRWNIVGMNHYHVGGRRRLYVSMTWRGPSRCCITAEGADGPELWDELARKSIELIGEQD
jgi:hypothetical protein